MYGIDVSHHQNPTKLDWNGFSGLVDFVIVRSSYGARLRDSHAVEHVRRARAIGAAVGLYHFLRDIHSVAAQFDLIRRVADAANVGAGDIVPTIDIEHDPIPKPGRDVSSAWNGPAIELVMKLDDHFRCKTMVYITQREFGMLGKPGWILDAGRPLWVAHYTRAPAPATPGNRPWNIWQHRVAPFDTEGPGGYDKKRPELDQNRARGPLPLIASSNPDAFEDDDGWDDLRDEVAARQIAWFDLIDDDSPPESVS